jgi:hypothetical protein
MWFGSGVSGILWERAKETASPNYIAATDSGVFNLEALGYNHYISAWVDHMLRVPIF